MSHIEILNGEVILDERAQVPHEASRFLNQHGGNSWIEHKRTPPPPPDESTLVPPLHHLYITKTKIGFGVGRKAYIPQGRTQENPVFYAEHHVQYEWSRHVFDKSIRL